MLHDDTIERYFRRVGYTVATLLLDNECYNSQKIYLVSNEIDEIPGTSRLRGVRSTIV